MASRRLERPRGRRLELTGAAIGMPRRPHAWTGAKRPVERPRCRRITGAAAGGEWAARNLSAASARLASPAERIERALAPWSAHFILPLFAFSATGVSIEADFSSRDASRIFAGIAVGLVVGKPLGILIASCIAIAARCATLPEGMALRHFIGAAALCGMGFTLGLLMTDRAFMPAGAAIVKLAVLAGSMTVGVLGALVLRYRTVPMTPADP